MDDSKHEPGKGGGRAFRTWLAAPHFEDAERDRRSRALNFLLLLLIAIGLLVFLATLAAGNFPKAFFYLGGTLAALLLWRLLHSRRLRLAIILTFAALLVLVTSSLLFNGGIHDLAVLLYPVTIVIAGLLLSSKGFGIVTLMTMATAAGVMAAEMLGWVNPARLQPASLYLLVNVIAVFTITALSVRMMAQDLLRSLARSRDSEHRLREGNALLQREVEQHQLSEAALRESEARFHTLADSAIEGICFSEDGTIIDANASLERLLACKEQGIIGRSLGDFFGPDMLSFITHEGSQQDDKPYEHMVRRCDGTFTAVESRTRTIAHQGRQVQVTTCLDVSERRRSEEEHRILEAEIRQSQKLDSLGTLAGGIAHDFNNIISIISGHADILARRLQGNAEALAFIHTISEAAERGGAMVRQILTFARKSEADYRALRIQDMIPELVKMLRVTFPRTLEIRYDCPVDLPQVWMDASQMHQALLNLCINSRDAMAGSGSLHIQAGIVDGETIAPRFPAAAGKRMVSIRVQDTGVGMDAQTRERIFEPFFTTKGRGKGTGLGLAVVYGVVQAHKGFIEVDSQPGLGTTFCLYFPASEPSEPLPAQDEFHEIPASRGNETILVVEDEEDLRDLLTSVLHDYGYGILVARDGMEALERYRRHRDDIQLVITDMDLPKINGAAVSRSILSDNPLARIILISGFVETAQKNAILASGVREFLAKPYTMPQMLHVIRRILDQD